MSSREERQAQREQAQAEAHENAQRALGVIPLKPQGGSAPPANVRAFASKNFKDPEGQLLANDQRWIDIGSLDPNPFQPEGRLNPAEIAGMVESFERDGQMQPVEVRPHPNPLLAGRFELVFGHRRHAAVKAGANAGIKQPHPQQYIGKLLCVVRAGTTDLEMLRRALGENNDRLAMSPLQAASMYVAMRELTTRELREAGEIAIGKEASWRQVAQFNGYGASKYADFARLAALLDLPPALRKYFEPEPGEADPEAPARPVLNSRHGRALLQFRNEPKQQNALLRAILSENLAGAQAEKRAEEMRKAQPSHLDIEVEQETKRQMREEKSESAGQAREDNRRALDGGRSHLVAVPLAEPEAEDQQARQVLAPDPTPQEAPLEVPISELQRGSGFDQGSSPATASSPARAKHPAVDALGAALQSVQQAGASVENAAPDAENTAAMWRQIQRLMAMLYGLMEKIDDEPDETSS